MEPIYPEPEFFFPGTFEVEPPYREGTPENMHQAGLDGIDPALDGNHSALTGLIGFDPYDYAHPSLDTREDIEKELPQWGPPFVKFVDGRITDLEKKVMKELEKWQFQTITEFFNVGVNTDANGNVNPTANDKATLFSPPPGFTLALHRLVILADGSNFGSPFGAPGSTQDTEGSTAAAPTAFSTIVSLAGGAPVAGNYNITGAVWQSGTPDANVANGAIHAGANVYNIPSTNTPQYVTINNVPLAAGAAIGLFVGGSNGGAGAIYNGDIQATLVGTTGYWEARVNGEMIDGNIVNLPFVKSWGTRDAPRIRDGEVLSLFMSGGPVSKRLTIKGQGSYDRTIEG